MRTLLTKTALTAGFALAMAFTFSCSGDDGSDGKPGEQGEPGAPGPGCSIATDAADPAYLLITCGSDTERVAKILWCETKAYNPATQVCEGGILKTLFTDIRDGKVYKSVVIGTQTWMAENLNYDVPDNSTDVCSGNDPAKCDTYGRLYDWSTAMAIDASCNTDNNCGATVSSKQQGVCPSGWHIPSYAEWNGLTTAVGTNPGTKLKAVSGWNSSGNGTDDFGFSALPGGLGGNNSFFGFVGDWGCWRRSDGRAFIINENTAESGNDDDKSRLYSVRCVQD
jgi:uncharacterized protein (TIGR02145 family)